jgi:predicted nucleic acid-binding protein
MDKRLLVVSNSSPIMNLAIIGQLHLIQELFGEIIIPKEVWAELIIEGKGKSGTNEIEKAKWIKVVKVKNDSLVKTLTKDLDVGESAAIALAIERKANLLLLDETDARNLAEFYNLTKTGVLGILMRAKKKGLIKNIKPMLEKLRIQAHFWIKPDLYDAILSEMGETPLA